MQSAFEREVVHLLLRLRATMASHDRAVLLGLILSVIPVPPLPLAGLLLSAFNYRLWKQHKLDLREIRLIRMSILLAVLSCAIAACLLVFGVKLMEMIDITDVLARGAESIGNVLHRLYDLVTFRRRGEITI